MGGMTCSLERWRGGKAGVVDFAATHCNTLQRTAMHCNAHARWRGGKADVDFAVTHCNAIHCTDTTRVCVHAHSVCVCVIERKSQERVTSRRCCAYIHAPHDVCVRGGERERKRVATLLCGCICAVCVLLFDRATESVSRCCCARIYVLGACICVYVCVCVCERERER